MMKKRDPRTVLLFLVSKSTIEEEKKEEEEKHENGKKRKEIVERENYSLIHRGIKNNKKIVNKKEVRTNQKSKTKEKFVLNTMRFSPSRIINNIKY